MDCQLKLWWSRFRITAVYLLRVKMVCKILRNSGSIFLYFSVIFYYSINTVIDTKTEYGVAGIGQNTVMLPYHLFSDLPKKSGNFSDLF
jgi:hypothetical protein